MKTILDQLGLRELASDRAELLELIEGEIDGAINRGDFLGMGEWLACKLELQGDEDIEAVFTMMIASWASPIEFKSAPTSINELITRFNEFVQEDLAASLVAATLKNIQLKRELPSATGDLAFRLSPIINRIFGITSRNPMELAIASARKLETARRALELSVASFLGTNCVSAKIASLDLLKKGHQLRLVSLPAEKSILSEMDVLVGPAFRKFCEACERQDTREVIKRAPDIRELSLKYASASGIKANSTLWHQTVGRVANHCLHLVEEAANKSRSAIIPSIGLATKVFKTDLTRSHAQTVFSARLINKGEGRAINVTLGTSQARSGVELVVLEPPNSFELGGESEQVIKLGLTLAEPCTTITIPITWSSNTVEGHPHNSEETIIIQQQQTQPDWNKLLDNPPYSLNPVKERPRLFGRDMVMQELLVHASGGSSTFVWGQKRVGKTSLLQVLIEELQKRGNYVCVVLRMGEIGPLHEGQIAHRIAIRIAEQLQTPPHEEPKEEAFGAGMATLVPYIERILRTHPKRKLIVVIDEFDDIDPAFYTGQRGKLFVKALRSLSEIGMTFFFVGSERMSIIYQTHQVDLNKWIDVSLDSIESREECKNLIVQPVAGAIEYQPECVQRIVDYCAGNPFYMNLFCSHLFKRSWQEQRTYVDENDLDNARERLIRTLGAANFSHFWEDNPELDEFKKVEKAAANCLLLYCISRLGGRFESLDELIEVQEAVGLAPAERLPAIKIRSTAESLLNRGILLHQVREERFQIKLPIFKDWLVEHAELHLLPRWRTFCREMEGQDKVKGSFRAVSFVDSHFPIPEEDLLAISQSLVYCGKQKDASEIRVWLKQFDDDNRIEIAFSLLKRLAERGFVTEGAKLQALSKVQDALRDVRAKIGKGQWNLVKGRNDNLCVGYLDTEMKSGGAIARELANRLRPGKRGHAEDLLDWMKSHVDKDPLLVLIDEFAGTGGSFAQALGGFMKNVRQRPELPMYLKERRILCYLLYAFPEALEKLRFMYREVSFMAANVFNDEVRSLDGEAGIFSNEQEIRFAKEVLVQIGRELWREEPLGYGDLGALVCFHNTCPNNTLPVFWSNGTVNNKAWKPLFPRP